MPRPTADEADLVPVADAAAPAYDREFYSWSLEQARLIRAGETGLDEDQFAELSPYSWHEIVSRDFTL